jgi:hypothetical protein
LRVLIDKALKRGYVLSPLAAPHHRRDGLVFVGPSAQGQAEVALSRRRSRPHRMSYERERPPIALRSVCLLGSG